MSFRKRPAFSESHAAPLIQILTWLFLAFSTLSIIAHFATKKVMSKPITKADLILLSALILAVCQGIIFFCPPGQLIGNSTTGLSEDAIMQAWKVLYSGQILYVLTLVAAKGSLLVPFMAVTPVVIHRRMMYTACAVTVLWGLSAVLITAFQCPSPQRWNITDPRCLDIERAVRTYNAVMNIITDLAIVIVPTLMVLPLQIESSTRRTLLTGFWCRFIVVIASIVHIIYIRALSPYTDLLNSIWRVIVCEQVVQVTSIVTSTIPFLKPFLLSLESGFLGASNATQTPPSAYDPRAKTRRLSSYIKIESHQSRDPSERTDKRSDIWVRKDVIVKEELSIELSEFMRKGN